MRHMWHLFRPGGLLSAAYQRHHCVLQAKEWSGVAVESGGLTLRSYFLAGKSTIYPAWSTFTKNKLENHHAIFMGKHTISISMAIFNSYSMAIVRNRTIPRDLCCGRPGAVFFLLP